MGRNKARMRLLVVVRDCHAQGRSCYSLASATQFLPTMWFVLSEVLFLCDWCFCFLVCKFMYNNDDVFVVFCLSVLFLFILCNNGGGFSTF